MPKKKAPFAIHHNLMKFHYQKNTNNNHRGFELEWKQVTFILVHLFKNTLADTMCVCVCQN